MGIAEKIEGVPMALTESQLESICVLFPAITWSSKDTDQTITEIKVHNAKHDSFCPDMVVK
jgi:hypothetical protein